MYQPQLTPHELKRVVTYALNQGIGAYADTDGAVIFVPIRRRLGGGVIHTHYRPQRVRTLTEAVSILHPG